MKKKAKIKVNIWVIIETLQRLLFLKTICNIAKTAVRSPNAQASNG